jgi:hypothetical protein
LEGFSGYRAYVATGRISIPPVYLLKKPVELRQDGYSSIQMPFMISFDGRDVFAAFTNVAVAAYFVSALRLDMQYKIVPLREIRPADLKDAEYAMVLRRKSQIDALLKGMITPSSFTRNLLKVR